MKDSLDTNITLKELQKYIGRVNTERGFDGETPTQRMLLLTEEIGELARAIRKESGMKFSDSTSRSELREEIADVQILLLGIAELTGIDIVKCVIDKDLKNQKRNWK